MSRLYASAAAALAAALLTGGPYAGAETPLDKYQSLLQSKRGLLRENAILQQEAAMAVTKAPYVLFHLKEGKLEFRVRGRGFKTYAFSRITMDEQGRRAADPEMVWKMLDKPITVIEVQGAHPELIPPDPDSGEEAGLIYSDANHLASQTGAAPVRTDAGVLGVDVPTDYYVKFEEGVVFHIRTPKTRSFREKAADRLSEIAQSMRATLSGLWTKKEIDVTGRPRLELYMMTDPDTAKYMHYSLLPGEKLFAVPPPPPPILLVAASQAGRPAGDAAAAPAGR